MPRASPRSPKAAAGRAGLGNLGNIAALCKDWNAFAGLCSPKKMPSCDDIKKNYFHPLGCSPLDLWTATGGQAKPACYFEVAATDANAKCNGGINAYLVQTCIGTGAITAVVIPPVKPLDPTYVSKPDPPNDQRFRSEICSLYLGGASVDAKGNVTPPGGGLTKAVRASLTDGVDGAPADAGMVDATLVDATIMDASPPDSGAADAQVPDASSPDASACQISDGAAMCCTGDCGPDTTEFVP